jgi:hypothetical protein
MSKRTLILFGVGVLLLIGALFSLKTEMTKADPQPEEEEETLKPTGNVSEESDAATI